MILLYILAIAVQQGAFGRGTGPILLSNVDCTGTESSLLSCRHTEETNLYCSHLFDVGVVCPSCKYLVALFKIGPQFLKQKGNILHIIQPTLHSTLGVYDNHPQIARYV